MARRHHGESDTSWALAAASTRSGFCKLGGGCESLAFGKRPPLDVEPRRPLEACKQSHKVPGKPLKVLSIAPYSMIRSGVLHLR